ncbi:glycerol-3-phosphate 1-O-acyltransferase PlsY [Bryobacter aggregatus]|uniref:glycerol-3-phosphate 1-O-acyltransferase PlsY n=1 Tax=Bryobacter aggregatus TaxID=360054 RepID=UPI0004E0BE65|nr:glycerol-3-phosphate 1-O-acyltransferase PlsY [Bryobacter aggregatus]
MWLIPLCFLLGSLPFGAWIVRLKTGKDVTAMGSGNIGATNVLRTTGKLAGILTLALDIGKGVLAVWLADHFTEGNALWMSAAAVAVMLGHGFSPFMNFKGGKAVASFAGAFAYLTPLPFWCIALLFVAVVAYSRYISLGSVLGAIFFPFAVWLILHPSWPVLLASLIAGVFVTWRHSANIERLRAGTENRFQWRKS